MSRQFIEELLWAGGAAIAIFVLSALTEVDAVTDWKLWAVAMGRGVVKAAAAALLAIVVKRWPPK